MQQDRSFGAIFRDNLDLALTAVIADRFDERASERSEGLTEFGNPATVTQPVHPSLLPSGQAIVPGRFGLGSPLILIVGAVALVGIGLLIARAR